MRVDILNVCVPVSPDVIREFAHNDLVAFRWLQLIWTLRKISYLHARFQSLFELFPILFRYVAFWLIVLASKFTFAYFLQARMFLQLYIFCYCTYLTKRMYDNALTVKPSSCCRSNHLLNPPRRSLIFLRLNIHGMILSQKVSACILRYSIKIICWLLLGLI